MGHFEANFGELDAGVLPNGEPASHYISEYLGSLLEEGAIKAAILIGSRARGGWRPWSDIDLLLLLRDEGCRAKVKAGLVDPRPYTLEELSKAIERCEVEVIEGFEEGIVLLDDGSWGEARRLYNKVKGERGIVKYRGGWRVLKLDLGRG